jgi:hypothetical protein
VATNAISTTKRTRLSTVPQVYKLPTLNLRAGWQVAGEPAEWKI